MKLFSLIKATTVVLSLTVRQASAGRIEYAVCQAGCASLVMACYTAAGFVWGTVGRDTASQAILFCNAAFGKCSAACAEATL